MTENFNKLYLQTLLDLANKAGNPELYAILESTGTLTATQIDMLLNYPEINNLFALEPKFQTNPDLIKSYIAEFNYQKPVQIQEFKPLTTESSSLNTSLNSNNSVNSTEIALPVRSNNNLQPQQTLYTSQESQSAPMAFAQPKSFEVKQELHAKEKISIQEPNEYQEIQKEAFIPESKLNLNLVNSQKQLQEKEKKRKEQLSANQIPVQQPESGPQQQNTTTSQSSKKTSGFKKAVFASIASSLSAATGLTFYQILIS